MRNEKLDLREAKRVVANWIEGLSVSDQALPDPVRQQLLDELAAAAPLIDPEGSIWFEIGALASLGFGIFRHSFRIGDALVCVSPYVPSGLVVGSVAVPAVGIAAPPVRVQADALGSGRAVPFHNLGSSRSGPI